MAGAIGIVHVLGSTSFANDERERQASWDTIMAFEHFIDHGSANLRGEGSIAEGRRLPVIALHREARILPAAIFPEADGAAQFSYRERIEIREHQQRIVARLVDTIDGCVAIPAKQIAYAWAQIEQIDRWVNAA